MYYYRYAPLLEVGLDMKNSQSPLLSKLRNDFWQSISHMYKDLKRWFGIYFLGSLISRGVPEYWLKIDPNFGKT